MLETNARTVDIDLWLVASVASASRPGSDGGGRGNSGVAGERWVPSTAVRAERNEDPEPRLWNRRSAALGVRIRAGLSARFRRGESSYGSSSCSSRTSPSEIMVVEDLLLSGV